MSNNNNNNNNNEVEFIVRDETQCKFGRCLFKYGLDNIPIYNNNIHNTTNYINFSQDGKLYAEIYKNYIRVYNINNNNYELYQEIEHDHEIQAIHISPNNKYIISWQKFDKKLANLNEMNVGNLIIWSINEKIILARYFQKEFDLKLWPTIQWSNDNNFYLRNVKNTILIYDGQKPQQKILSKLHIPNIRSFNISPILCRVAAFIPDKNGAPAKVQIYDYSSFEEKNCMASKSFFKAEDIDIIWNSIGTAVLIQTRTDHDTSGKTYYGETALHLLHADGSFSCSVPSQQSGPMQGIGWHPKGRNFIVIQGKQPATSTLFSMDNCTPLFSFGSGPHNTVRFSPHGRFLCLGGFGNLAGHMDFWDFNKKKKIGSCQDRDGAKSFEWAPDGRSFITAVLRPWRRVDNGFRVWSYAGELLYHENIETLYEIIFRPNIDENKYPDKPQSPRLKDKRYIAERKKAEEAAKPQAYVPPSKRKLMAARAPRKIVGQKLNNTTGPKKFTKAEQVALIANSDVEINAPTKLTAAAKRRQRKKRQAERKKEEERLEKLAEEMEKKRQMEAEQQRLDNMSDKEKTKKRIKAINKKLRQIDNIRKLEENGEILDDAAIKKMSKEVELRKELESLLQQ